MGLTAAKTILFNDGEGLTHDDLNKLTLGATQRAWEWPGYADAFAHAQLASTTYASSFDSGTDLNRTVFCKGGGPEVSFTGLTLNIGAGFIGIYSASASPALLDPKMQWAYISGSQAVALTTAPAGQKRFDVITLSVAEANSDLDPRDFEDGVTGALTTTSINKRRSLTGTLAVTSGAAAVFALGSAPVPPGTSTYIVAVALVGDTAIEAVYDCMQPFGQQYTSISIPEKDSIFQNGSADWAVGAQGAMLGTGSAGVLVLFPPMLRGDSTAKLMGMEIKYTLTASTVVELAAVSPSDIAGATTLRTITSLFTLGSPQTTRIDFRGYPIFQGADRFHTFWASGDYVKRGQLQNWGKSLALKITNGGAGSSVAWVRWFFGK